MKKKRLLLFFDFILIVTVFISFINACLGLYLHSLIETEVRKNTKGKYEISIGRARLNIITRSISFYNVNFEPVSHASSSFKGNSIKVLNVNIRELFFEDKISVGAILIDGSDIILRGSDEKTSESKTETEFLLYDIFKSRYRSVYIEKTKVENINFKYFRNSGDSSLIVQTSHGEISISRLLIDSATTYIQKKPFNADSLDINLKNIANILNDSLYTLKIPILNISYTKKIILIDSLQLIPNYDKEEFMKVAGEQTDRFIIFMKKILLNHVDVKELFENFQINASHLLIDSLHTDIYRNKYIPVVPREKKFVQELIKNIQMQVKIDSIDLNDSYVQYEELLPPSKVAGKISFSQANISVKNFSNYSSDSMLVLNVRSKAMQNNITPVEFNLNFPMNTTTLNGNGITGKINMSVLNSMLEGPSKATITNGIIDSMKFTLYGNKKFFGGSLTMLYHDLRIAAKDIEHNDTSKAKLKVISFIANNFILKKSNPDDDNKTRSVVMERDYKSDKFFLSNAWKTILQGIQKTIGAPVKKD